MKTRDDKYFSISQFAAATGKSRSWIRTLTQMREDLGGIKATIIRGHPYINTEKYPVEKFIIKTQQ